MSSLNIYNDAEIYIIGGSYNKIDVAIKDVYGFDYASLDIDKLEWRLAKYGETKTLIKKTYGANLSVAANIVTITLNDSDTSSLSGGVYSHQLILTDKAKKVFVYDCGRIYIKEQIR